MPPEKKTEAPKLADTAPVTLTDTQLAHLERAIVLSGVISGLLAAGRIPNSPENQQYGAKAFAFAMELLNR